MSLVQKVGKKGRVVQEDMESLYAQMADMRLANKRLAKQLKAKKVTKSSQMVLSLT